MRITKVSKEKRSGGTFLRFKGEGTCCWQAGSRDLLVTLQKSKKACVIQAITGTDQGVNRPFWDESQEECFGLDKVRFTKLCLDWIKEHILLPNKERFPAIEVLYPTGFYEANTFREWVAELRDSFKSLPSFSC